MIVNTGRNNTNTSLYTQTLLITKRSNTCLSLVFVCPRQTFQTFDMMYKHQRHQISSDNIDHRSRAHQNRSRKMEACQPIRYHKDYQKKGFWVIKIYALDSRDYSLQVRIWKILQNRNETCRLFVTWSRHRQVATSPLLSRPLCMTATRRDNQMSIVWKLKYFTIHNTQ